MNSSMSIGRNGSYGPLLAPPRRACSPTCWTPMEIVPPSMASSRRIGCDNHPCEHGDVFQRNYLGRLGFGLSTKEAPLVLPAILNPFIEDAPAAVMTRIALDWITTNTPLDDLFGEVAEGQYTREFTLSHFVHVMLDVACGYRPSPRAAFLRRDLFLTASISAFYRKLNRMELAVPEAVVRRTAQRARQLIVAADGLLPEPVEGYAV